MAEHVPPLEELLEVLPLDDVLPLDELLPPFPEDPVHAPPCELSAVALHVNVAPLMHA